MYIIFGQQCLAFRMYNLDECSSSAHGLRHVPAVLRVSLVPANSVTYTSTGEIQVRSQLEFSGGFASRCRLLLLGEARLMIIAPQVFFGSASYRRIVLHALQQGKFGLAPNLNLVGALPRGADFCF